ncbi:MAG: hypothetical protein FWH00_03505 [Oscillospiraceae bacterium]|nr:hypothetical protein [Oscillospiraceae bacterium]
MHELLDRVISLFLPQRCVFCDKLVEYDDYWCEKCGKPGEPPFTRQGNIGPNAFAGAEYSGNIRNAVFKLKDRGDKRAAKFFAHEIYCAINITFDVIIPVPMARSKFDQLGYNQAQLLGDALGRMTGVPIRADALIRHEDTLVQHGLSAAQRETNAARSYDIGNAQGLQGKTILLVDDVYTTGSTARACTKKLLEAGAGAVYTAAAASQAKRL